MALLGVQLVITLVTVSIIQKIGVHYSFARWLLCSTGLHRYLYPTNKQLRELAGLPGGGKSTRHGGARGRRAEGDANGRTEETFHVPRDLPIELEQAPVSPLDVVHLRYYTEYQWLMDFALYAAVVYLITEIATAWNVLSVEGEVNLSCIWLVLGVLFSWRALGGITAHYWGGAESAGERSTVLVCGAAYLLVAMLLLVLDERTLELQLEPAYDSFSREAARYTGSGANTASKLIVKLLIALWCACLGALHVFPGLRVARMHADLSKSLSKIKRAALSIAAAAPFLLVVLWIKPIARDYLTERIFRGMTTPLLTTAQFESLRLWLVLAACVLRLALMPLHLQAYLDMARDRLEIQKREAGRILNTELQRRIAAVFYYSCVVAVQYAAPLVNAVFCAMLLKSLGGYSWSGQTLPDPECLPNDSEPSLAHVFNVTVWRGLLNVATFWSCFVWFASTSIGFVYQSYFTHT